MSMITRVVWTSILVVAVVSCTPGQDNAVPTATATVVVAAFDTKNLGPGCQADEALRLVTSFLDAFNRGDQQRLTELFPAESAGSTVTNAMMTPDVSVFQVYFVNQRDAPPFAVATRADLLRYFEQRHTHGEQLHLTELSVRPWGRYGQSADLIFAAVRHADDVTERRVEGKGRINCEQQQIILWGFGDDA